MLFVLPCWCPLVFYVGSVVYYSVGGILCEMMIVAYRSKCLAS